MIPHHGKASLPNRRHFISIDARMQDEKNGEALAMLAGIVSNGFALSTETTKERHNRSKFYLNNFLKK